MTEAVQMVLVALAALLVGVTIPVLMSVRAAMKQAQATMSRLEVSTAEVLTRAGAVLRKADTIAGELRDGSTSVTKVSRAAEELAETLARMQRSMRIAAAVASAVAPAVAAAVKSLRREGHAGEGPPAPREVNMQNEQNGGNGARQPAMPRPPKEGG